MPSYNWMELAVHPARPHHTVGTLEEYDPALIGDRLHLVSGEPGAAHGLMDQFAERAVTPVMRTAALPGMLSHGAFLRWPSLQAAGLALTTSPEECALFAFPPHPGHDLGTENLGLLLI